MPTPGQHAWQDTLPAAETQNIKRLVLTGAQTLLASQSGALCIFNSATGFTFTLPAISAANVGTYFDFFCSVTNTATVAKILAQGTDYIIGAVTSAVDATTPSSTAGPKAFAFNGSTHLACNFGGTDTTSGGVAGTRVRFEMLPSLKWGISGSVIAAGTIVTPAATS